MLVRRARDSVSSFAACCVSVLFPRSPFAIAGVLGDASAIAEHLEAHAAPNTVSCSVAARAAYLSSGYSFTPSEDIIDASPQAPFPPGNLRAATGRGGNGHNGRRLSAPSLVLSQRRVVGFANDAFARSNGGTATVQVRNETHWQQPEAQESSPFTVTGLLPSAPQWQMTGQSWAIHQPAAFIVQAAASADAAMIT